MRRIIHNTTAIAACLSLLASNMAFAETRVAESGPVRLAQADDQRDTNVKGSDEESLWKLIEAEKDKKEQAEARKKANKEKQEAKKDAQQAKKAQKKAEKETKANKADKKERRAEKEKPKAERKSAKADEKAERSKPPAAAQEARKERGDEKRPSAAQRNRDDEKRPRQAERAKNETRPKEKVADRADRKDDTAQSDRRQLSLSSSGTAKTRLEAMPALGSVLATELDRGLTRSDLKCLSGGSYPCADGDLMMTPKGVVVGEASGGQLVMAAAPKQMFRADSDGRMTRRVAEEGTVETDGAKQAARETRVRNAEALQDDRKGNVTTKKVTRENTRTSSEDFTTSLRNALQQGDQRQRDTKREEAKKDDDDNDLTKALLLGLGALAVGSYLNNQRQVALSTPDRVVVTRPDGSQEVIKDEVALLRQPGSDVTTENFDDGSSRTVVTRADGSKVVTIRDSDLRVLRRTLVSPDGRTTRLIDDTEAVEPVDIAALPAPAQPVAQSEARMDEAALRAALQRESNIDRRFNLGQIRNIPEVRALVAPVDIDAITFDTGSAAIKPDQAQQLSSLGNVIQEAVASNPQEIFMIEGYTDTVGTDATNLALSDRRAESVALALTEYFDVPPENLVVQGYGEQFLKVRAEGDIRENRRASVRRITDLLRTAQAN